MGGGGWLVQVKVNPAVGHDPKKTPTTKKEQVHDCRCAINTTRDLKEHQHVTMRRAEGARICDKCLRRAGKLVTQRAAPRGSSNPKKTRKKPPTSRQQQRGFPQSRFRFISNNVDSVNINFSFSPLFRELQEPTFGAAVSRNVNRWRVVFLKRKYRERKGLREQQQHEEA